MKNMHFFRCSRTLAYLVMTTWLLVSISSCHNEEKEKAKPPGDSTKTTEQTGAGEKEAAPSFTDTLTVADLRLSADRKTLEVLFLEKERPFSYANAGDEVRKTLESALASKAPVVVTASEGKGLLNRVSLLSSGALEKYWSGRSKDTLKAARPIAIDISKIDTAVFNKVGKNIFRPVGCTNVVPNYATAVTLFNFCAKQLCNTPGVTVNPCIPFQYVRDGCYARAHKMRWIIENMYHYCTQKVFSFANNGTDVLAVQATKWGGCCVTWWYHVTPLIIVKIGARNYYYVIDPGMFNQPVPLATWLQAQANKNCARNANVTKYVIQPSSAYTPANYQGTAFTTDPNYTATNATLINYRNLKTCP